MTRRAELAVALVLLAMCAGLTVWTWYLSSRTLAEADQASSVLGGFAAVVVSVVGVVLAVLGRRQPGRRRTRRPAPRSR